MSIGSPGFGGGGAAASIDFYPLWKSDTDGGVYAINNQVSFEGNTYRNLSGTNTDTDPSADSVNWVRVQIVTLTQAEFDALVLAGDDQADIFYDISDAAPLRIPTVFIVADIAARDALVTQQEGDTARVLDNGFNNPENFIWDGSVWQNYPTPTVLTQIVSISQATQAVPQLDSANPMADEGVVVLFPATSSDRYSMAATGHLTILKNLDHLNTVLEFHISKTGGTADILRLWAEVSIDAEVTFLPLQETARGFDVTTDGEGSNVFEGSQDVSIPLGTVFRVKVGRDNSGGTMTLKPEASIVFSDFTITSFAAKIRVS